MKKITEADYKLLVDEIYDSFMAISMYDKDGEEVNFGMGEMGECHDAAKLVVDNWMSKAEIIFETINQENETE